MTIATLERLLAKVVPSQSNCWGWKGSKSRGYAYFYADKRQRPAHLWLYEEVYGRVPKGFELDHTCHTVDCKLVENCPHRSCVRLTHLEMVTKSENMKRGRCWLVNSEKTNCKYGHPFNEQNTATSTKRGNAERSCRTCNRRRQAEYRAKGKDSIQ